MAELPRRVSRESVVQSAAGQIRRHGIARLELDEVAAGLGVAPAAVRYWFTDETDLLVSIMQIRQRWFLDEADTWLAPLPTQTQKLRGLVDLYVAEHEVSYWVELLKLGLRDERAREARQTLTALYRDQFARVIRAGQRSGEFAVVGPDQAALVLVALVDGLSIEATLGDAAAAELMRSILINVSERLLEVDLEPLSG